VLKSSLTMPKWQYLLRTSPCFNSEKLAMIDNVQRESLSSTLIVLLLDETWCQASLPVRWGGVGWVSDLWLIWPHRSCFHLSPLYDIYFQQFFPHCLPECYSHKGPCIQDSFGRKHYSQPSVNSSSKGLGWLNLQCSSRVLIAKFSELGPGTSPCLLCSWSRLMATRLAHCKLET